jgi:hypothetical protein
MVLRKLDSHMKKNETRPLHLTQKLSQSSEHKTYNYKNTNRKFSGGSFMTLDVAVTSAYDS